LLHRLARSRRPAGAAHQLPRAVLVRDELCGLFGLDREKVRVLTARVGGGFGSKQELLTEDLVALAVLRTGRPVQHEFTRTVELTAAPCRHPMSVTVRVGANTDGLLTALAIDVLADAGAYGNHSPGVMFHGCHESMGMYRFPISGQRPVGLHQQPAVWSVPWIRARAGHFRYRVRTR
jgi:CO/xanthine dehydrogenase Mo-binding subunit